MDGNKRNTKKLKMKRNKGYPYKRIPCHVNQTKKYKVLDEAGKVIDRYRLKQTATQEHGIKSNIVTTE